MARPPPKVRVMRFLFKICPRSAWDLAAAAGHYAGSDLDRRDGFIHLSSDSQVRETAARHFAGQEGLVLVALPVDGLDGLRWEASRGGALFPHVYGTIPVTKVLWVRDLPLMDGLHVFPPEAGA
jgi:uncharacterized protein (DUF952 family)